MSSTNHIDIREMTEEDVKKALAQREAELSLINSIQDAINSDVDMQGIYNLVGQKLQELFKAQVVSISLVNPEEDLEEIKYFYEDGAQIYPQPRKIDKLRQQIINSKKTVLINTDFIEEIEELTGHKIQPIPGTDMPKSVLFVPMMVRNEVTGVLSIQNLDRENAFEDSDVQLLETVANSVSTALENARLYSEAEQRNAELSVINSVQQGLVAEMDMQGIYDLVGNKIKELFDSQITVIATFDHENNIEIFNYAFEDGKRFYLDSRPFDNIRQRLIQTKKLIHINGNSEESLKELGSSTAPAPGTEDPKSMLYVPLIIGDTIRGYVSLQNIDKENAFSDSDIRLLSTLANSMSVALENARLFNETEQRNAELAVINSVQKGLAAEMDMQGINDLVGEKIRDLFDAQVVAIASFDLENRTEKIDYLFEDGHRFEAEIRPIDKFRSKLIESQETIYLNENVDEMWTEITGEIPTVIPGTQFTQSALYVPMMVGKEVRGYVTLQNVDRENAFSESDVRLLKTLVNSMSVALENARLFNETEQRNAELAVINSVQEALVAEMNMQGIYDLVGDKIQQLFDAQVVGINTIDLENGIEHFKYAYEVGGRIELDPVPLDKLRMKLVETKKMIWFSENILEEWCEFIGEKPKAVPGTNMPKTALFVPMLVGDKVIGYVTLQNIDHENAYSDSDVRLLNTLVNSMSVSLESARLFNETTRLLAETEQRNAELAVINSVQEGLVREMNMEAIYALVCNRICEVLNTQTLIIRTFDLDKGIENWDYATENGERLHVEPKPFIWANKHLIKTSEPLVINRDYLATAQSYGDTSSGVSKGLPPKSAIFVPMIVGGNVVGSVSLQNVEKENAFTDSDLSLLTTLTNSMSVALENARLFNETNRLLAETEQRATEMQTVNNISRALVSQLEFTSLMKLVGDQMRDTFHADIVYLAIFDVKTNTLHFPYMFGEDDVASREFGNGITEKIIRSKEPLLINQNMEKLYDDIDAVRMGVEVESYLGVPIIVGNQAIGVISVQSREKKNRFNEFDLRLLKTIAANVGVAMQNAEAYEKLQVALTDLESAQEQLIQQEKLASLGQLSAGIAHEIKNPLNFVNNFSELNLELIEEITDELKELPTNEHTDEISAILEDITSNLKKIHQHGTRADSIVKSMLQHSRGSNGIKEELNINEILNEYINLAFHGMRASKKVINVSIDLQLDHTIQKVPLIAEDFSRVILNLCNNAFDAMYEEQNISKNTDYSPKLSVRSTALGKSVIIEIEDNGPGIPENLKDKIMQPFFTTKKGTEGTGLGLSITNDIIKAHGGRLEIVSESGNNSYTKFKIILPT
ncbi:GAF domain-containing protein [Flavobacteriaceae bacterium MAR_2010_188]|nr:GAF domain-containing protein [Flavobacteriaceae bacterium MAR_2010_188]